MSLRADAPVCSTNRNCSTYTRIASRRLRRKRLTSSKSMKTCGKPAPAWRASNGLAGNSRYCVTRRRNIASTPATRCKHGSAGASRNSHETWLCWMVTWCPGVYDLTLGARSIVDDNFAYEVWQMANRYSVQQTEDPPLETLNLSGDEVWLKTRKLRIRRRLPRMKQMLKPAGLKSRKRESHQGEWAQADRRRIDLFVPAGRRRYRELRPLSEAVCQDHAVRRAFARGGVLDVDARWHRPPRDDSQLA